ncbi:unnamed protein product, partial [Rotaria magnacalcarata]
VLANIVEIPPPYRHYQQNTMMLSIWHSPRSASAPVLFERIIQDLLQLVQHGLDIEFDDLGSIHFDVFIQGVCADGPGQSKITDIVSHNGYYACRVCEMHGCYITGDNTCTYPWSLFERTSPPFRTRDRFEYCINEIKRLKAMGNRNINVMGIKNISPLNDIIFIPTQSIYDYMHLCLVGHTTIILKECNDYHPGSSKQANSIIGEFDHFLSNIQYPHNINRKVKNFRCFNDWKAAQIRIFLLYLSLPFIQYQTHYFPPLIVFHFSLYAIYIRTLCKFTDRQQIYDVRIFIENHLRRFKQFYTKSKELLSTHCNMHLWQQVIRHGALSATSMFGSESCLHGLYKLAHGTKNIGEQVAYWYTIHRHVHFISFPNQRDINHQGHFMDHYVDERVIQDYKVQYQNAFFRTFSCQLDEFVVYRSRYKIELIVYHSLSYSLKRKSSSFNVCVTNDNCPNGICYGTVVFYFTYRREMFLFLLYHPCSCTNTFSASIQVDEDLPMWSETVNRFYTLLDKSVVTFIILPCTSLRSKCFFFPSRDDRFIVCTPIDNELEHD